MDESINLANNETENEIEKENVKPNHALSLPIPEKLPTHDFF